MLTKRFWITLTICVFAGGGFAAGQARKPGLWQIATNTKILQPGETIGNFGASQSTPIGGVDVCITPEMMEKFGVIQPPSLRACELSNTAQTADGFKADMTCKGTYNGVGSVESTWIDENHVVGKVRFVSKTRETTDAHSIRWVQESTAEFKSSDCGGVKPHPMPDKEKR